MKLRNIFLVNEGKQPAIIQKIKTECSEAIAMCRHDRTLIMKNSHAGGEEIVFVKPTVNRSSSFTVPVTIAKFIHLYAKEKYGVEIPDKSSLYFGWLNFYNNAHFTQSDVDYKSATAAEIHSYVGNELYVVLPRNGTAQMWCGSQFYCIEGQQNFVVDLQSLINEFMKMTNANYISGAVQSCKFKPKIQIKTENMKLLCERANFISNAFVTFGMKEYDEVYTDKIDPKLIEALFWVLNNFESVIKEELTLSKAPLAHFVIKLHTLEKYFASYIVKKYSRNYTKLKDRKLGLRGPLEFLFSNNAGFYLVPVKPFSYLKMIFDY
jgi:hypothetical protein